MVKYSGREEPGTDSISRAQIWNENHFARKAPRKFIVLGNFVWPFHNALGLTKTVRVDVVRYQLYISALLYQARLINVGRNDWRFR